MLIIYTNLCAPHFNVGDYTSHDDKIILNIYQFPSHNRTLNATKCTDELICDKITLKHVKEIIYLKHSITITKK